MTLWGISKPKRHSAVCLSLPELFPLYEYYGNKLKANKTKFSHKRKKKILKQSTKVQWQDSLTSSYLNKQKEWTTKGLNNLTTSANNKYEIKNSVENENIFALAHCNRVTSTQPQPIVNQYKTPCIQNLSTNSCGLQEISISTCREKSTALLNELPITVKPVNQCIDSLPQLQRCFTFQNLLGQSSHDGDIYDQALNENPLNNSLYTGDSSLINMDAKTYSDINSFDPPVSLSCNFSSEYDFNENPQLKNDDFSTAHFNILDCIDFYYKENCLTSRIKSGAEYLH